MDKTSSIYLYVKLNWDANRFLPAESKDCMNSASYEYRNMSARWGAQFVQNYVHENIIWLHKSKIQLLPLHD